MLVLLGTPDMVFVDSPIIAAAPVTVSGWLVARWIEDFSHPGSGAMQYLLLDSFGRETEVTFAGLSPASITARHALVGRYVTITGDQLTNGTIGVQSIWHDYAIPTDLTISGVSGAHPYISILCRFADSPTVEPHPPAFYAPIVDNSYPHLDHYWRAVSYGSMSLSGSGTASAWVTLPQRRSYYIISETDPRQNLYGQLTHDCISAADAEIYFPSHVGVNMFFNSGLGCCSVGGIQTVTIDGQTRSYGITLMNPDHHNQLAVLAHEIGHTFGFPHSSGPYGNIYDSSWDVMSSPGGRCAVSDPSFECVPQHPIAFHKDLPVGFRPVANSWPHAA